MSSILYHARHADWSSLVASLSLLLWLAAAVVASAERADLPGAGPVLLQHIDAGWRPAPPPRRPAADATPGVTLR